MFGFSDAATHLKGPRCDITKLTQLISLRLPSLSAFLVSSGCASVSSQRAAQKFNWDELCAPSWVEPHLCFDQCSRFSLRHGDSQ